MTSKAKKIGTCNRYTRVWAAMLGCEGRAPFVGWEAPTTMGGSYTPNYTCPTCARFSAMTMGLNHPEHQDVLGQVEALAGVTNYRYQGTDRDKASGRPFLVNRREGTAWTMTSILTRWTDLVPHRAD